jgi:hypothetical protein
MDQTHNSWRISWNRRRNAPLSLWKICGRVTHVPFGVFPHDRGKVVGCLERVKPRNQLGPGLGVKPILVDVGELPDKGQDRHIRQFRVSPEQVRGQLIVQRHQKL